MHPGGDSALGHAQDRGDLCVVVSLRAKFPCLGVQVVLGPGTAGPLRWRLTAQDLVQGGIAPDVEQGLDFAAGVAGPAEGDGLLP